MFSTYVHRYLRDFWTDLRNLFLIDRKTLRHCPIKNLDSNSPILMLYGTWLPKRMGFRNCRLFKLILGVPIKDFIVTWTRVGKYPTPQLWCCKESHSEIVGIPWGFFRFGDGLLQVGYFLSWKIKSSHGIFKNLNPYGRSRGHQLVTNKTVKNMLLLLAIDTWIFIWWHNLELFNNNSIILRYLTTGWRSL